MRLKHILNDGLNRHLGKSVSRSLPGFTVLLLGLLLAAISVTAQTSSSSSLLPSSASVSASASASISSSPSITRTISLSTLPTALSLDPLNASSPAIQLDLPQTPSLYITLNLCSVGSNSSILPWAVLSTASPPDFATGRTSEDADTGGLGTSNRVGADGDVWRLEWTKGFANWTSDEPDITLQASLLLALGLDSDGTLDTSTLPSGFGNVVMQIGVSTRRPHYTVSPASIFLGDTTPNSALLFSPLLMSSPQTQPTYPNYTLPGAQLVFDPYPGPGSQTDLTTLGTDLSLIIAPTGSSPTNDGLDFSQCAVIAANTSTGYVANPASMLVNATTQWMSVGGVEGFRTMWVVGDLAAGSNYTAWLVDTDGGVSQPIWFSTKEADFPCQLILPNDMCPNIAYAAPLEANTTTLPGTTTPFPLDSVPDNIASLLTTSLDHFSSSLLSSACGRDLFSHVSSCLDCYNAYRDWLCRIAIPQCAGTPRTDAPVQPQTIAREPDSPRVANITAPYAYTELLPCLSTCNRADRQCPAFMAFRCPRRQVNAGQSYAYLGEETDEGDGEPTAGQPAADQWGNRWCNG